MIVYRFDQEGYYLEPVKLKNSEPIPSDCTAVPLPEINYKPQYVDGAWVETLSQSEIDALLNAPKPLSELEQVKKQQADLTFQLMLAGVI
jgi:hypothetical protein